MIKKILKMLGGLVGGVVVGILIGGFIVVVIKGGSLADYFDKLLSTDLVKMAKVMGYMVLWMLVSGVLHIIFHEGGHLVAGLLTGYRFVSFRVFSLTLIKRDGHFQFRRFSIGGTGGQCLMAPPERPLDQIDTRWYNLGGVLANLLIAGIALLVFCLFDLPMWAGTWMLMLIVIGMIYALMNGLPLKISGVPNDGYNLMNLEKNKATKQLLCIILQANASIQEGLQPKDLPASYFSMTGDIDWTDGLQANWQMMVAARMANLHQWEELYALLQEAVKQKDKMATLFWQEFVCEMIFACLVTGRTEEARQLYTPDIQKYIQDYAPIQSSKQRIIFTIDLLLEGKEEKALETLQTVKNQREQYLLQGEVSMDIELMEWVKSAHTTGVLCGEPVEVTHKNND